MTDGSGEPQGVWVLRKPTVWAQKLWTECVGIFALPVLYTSNMQSWAQANLFAGDQNCNVGMGGTQENFTPSEKETEQWK